MKTIYRGISQNTIKPILHARTPSPFKRNTTPILLPVSRPYRPNLPSDPFIPKQRPKRLLIRPIQILAQIQSLPLIDLLRNDLRLVTLRGTPRAHIPARHPAEDVLEINFPALGTVAEVPSSGDLEVEGLE